MARCQTLNLVIEVRVLTREYLSVMSSVDGPAWNWEAAGSIPVTQTICSKGE